jgi:phthalate 4,5-cis-dihydrodiol dehydrogenase
VLIASCDRGDIRTTPEGLCVYEDLAVSKIQVQKDRDGEGRGAVLDEFAVAIAGRIAPLHDGRWGKATLEVCLAMLESSRERREVRLEHQCAANG